jgi:phytoene dehydrogenase-like protein
MRKKIVIIGGGIAGISAGIFGQKKDFDTEIYEMHTIPGGQCTAWDRKGYRFDYCLHWLVGTRGGSFHKIWKETDVLNSNVKVMNQEIHSKIVDEEGNELIIYTSIDRWEKYLVELAPEDEKEINKMCRDMRKFSKMDQFENPPELRTILDYAGMVIKILPAIRIIGKFGKKTCKQYFDTFNFKSPAINVLIKSFYGEADFSALAFLMMLTWFDQNNAGYLMGGSMPLIRRMTDKYKSLGGKLLTGKKVEKIIVENNKACGISLSDGTIINADYVISAADGHSTIFKLLEGKYLSKKINEAYNTWPLFTPLVQVSFGINKALKWDYPVVSYLSKNIKVGRTSLDHGYSIMNYSFDPSMSPEGKSTIILRFESPWELWQNLTGESYTNEKKQMEADALSLLEKKFPEVKGHVEVIDIATPRTDVDYTGVWKGAYEGFLPTGKNILETLKTTIPGLKRFYMCGQWLFPGGGLPPSAQSGKWVIDLITKKKS